jgi:hypothetical protein
MQLKFHTEDPQILLATVENLVATATWRPGFAPLSVTPKFLPKNKTNFSYRLFANLQLTQTQGQGPCPTTASRILNYRCTAIMSKSAQAQLNTIVQNYMFRPISGHPQVHNLCLEHTEEGI